MTWDELTENRLKQIYGAPDAKWGHSCSDLTGYLWTDEEFVVNNHDIIALTKEELIDDYTDYCDK